MFHNNFQITKLNSERIKIKFPASTSEIILAISLRNFLNISRIKSTTKFGQNTPTRNLKLQNKKKFNLFLYWCFRFRVGVFCPNLVVDLILEIFRKFLRFLLIVSLNFVKSFRISSNFHESDRTKSINFFT